MKTQIPFDLDEVTEEIKTYLIENYYRDLDDSENEDPPIEMEVTTDSHFGTTYEKEVIEIIHPKTNRVFHISVYELI